eukprot:gene22781-29948_t
MRTGAVNSAHRHSELQSARLPNFAASPRQPVSRREPGTMSALTTPPGPQLHLRNPTFSHSSDSTEYKGIPEQVLSTRLQVIADIDGVIQAHGGFHPSSSVGGSTPRTIMVPLELLNSAAVSHLSACTVRPSAWAHREVKYKSSVDGIATIKYAADADAESLLASAREAVRQMTSPFKDPLSTPAPEPHSTYTSSSASPTALACPPGNLRMLSSLTSPDLDPNQDTGSTLPKRTSTPIDSPTQHTTASHPGFRVASTAGWLSNSLSRIPLRPSAEAGQGGSSLKRNDLETAGQLAALTGSTSSVRRASRIPTLDAGVSTSGQCTLKHPQGGGSAPSGIAGPMVQNSSDSIINAEALWQTGLSEATRNLLDDFIHADSGETPGRGGWEASWSSKSTSTSRPPPGTAAISNLAAPSSGRQLAVRAEDMETAMLELCQNLAAHQMTLARLRQQMAVCLPRLYDCLKAMLELCQNLAVGRMTFARLRQQMAVQLFGSYARALPKTGCAPICPYEAANAMLELYENLAVGRMTLARLMQQMELLDGRNSELASSLNGNRPIESGRAKIQAKPKSKAKVKPSWQADNRQPVTRKQSQARLPDQAELNPMLALDGSVESSRASRSWSQWAIGRGPKL